MEIVCISDTHNRHRELTLRPDILGTGDVLVHSGDFTNLGTLAELREFVDWFAAVPGFRHKVLVAGNHDICLDPDRFKEVLPALEHRANTMNKTNKTGDPKQKDQKRAPAISREDHRAAWELVARNPAFHYLYESGTVLDGVRFYGAPYVVLDPSAATRWAFSLSDMEIAARRIWERVPANTDVLVTHGPPFGIMDRAFMGNKGDDFLLLEVMERVQPRLHIFGHIHNQQGECTVGCTRFVNAASQGEYDTPLLPPVRVRLEPYTNESEAARENSNGSVPNTGSPAPGSALRSSSPLRTTTNGTTIATWEVKHI